eukprot:XP_001704372.1 Hypothetical protein GL50803_38272 [Giardia lamblia ATCC 50803]
MWDDAQSGPSGIAVARLRLRLQSQSKSAEFLVNHGAQL